MNNNLEEVMGRETDLEKLSTIIRNNFGKYHPHAITRESEEAAAAILHSDARKQPRFRAEEHNGRWRVYDTERGEQRDVWENESSAQWHADALNRSQHTAPVVVDIKDLRRGIDRAIAQSGYRSTHGDWVILASRASDAALAFLYPYLRHPELRSGTLTQYEEREAVRVMHDAVHDAADSGDGTVGGQLNAALAALLERFDLRRKP